jgi:cytochrome P450
MVSIEQLTEDPHPHLARLRAEGPVTWVPSLDAWLVTGRAAAVDVLRDAETFTVDDPRFSTGRVVGPSMLSTDGPSHARHRAAFAAALRPAQTRARLAVLVDEIARRRVRTILNGAAVDLRADLAAPVAADVAIAALDLVDTGPDDVLAWYGAIVDAVSSLSVDDEAVAPPALMDGIREAVTRTLARPDSALTRARADADLNDEEFVSNVAVVLFGALETAEAMIANLLREIVLAPELAALLGGNTTLRDRAIDESLRLEPGASFVDRFAVVADARFGVAIRAGDHVIVSLAGANRDPTAHRRPDDFSLQRQGEPAHLTFATGPHVCLGSHLARMEARAVLDAWFAHERTAIPAREGFDAPHGFVFRKPPRLAVATSASVSGGRAVCEDRGGPGL